MGNFKSIFDEVPPCVEGHRSSKKYSSLWPLGAELKSSKLSSCPITSFPAFSLQFPRASEEHVPLSSRHGAAPSFSGGLLVDTNLDTSSPDTYRPPPAPIPFNVTSSITETPSVAQEISSDKSNNANASLNPTNSNSVQETVAGSNNEVLAKLEDLKESECQVQNDLEIDSAKDSEIERTKLAEEEDTCPICLEEYDAENPKLTTKCIHHFHLACILEWMERKETCPVCDEDLVFDPPS
ncbi:putative E3 ubiquitin-protein ligase RHB1A isoform X1 [Senna tora]|uniref:RING-type E3 ubiquitin transferase n=1 Tax=Senna tora TaxID=362788 RepID=A0A834T5T5_9FABA|nr:putative E3 ubiquitin-protein ligase RHB1A isoform X1 [Senna tora]